MTQRRKRTPQRTEGAQCPVEPKTQKQLPTCVLIDNSVLFRGRGLGVFLAFESQFNHSGAVRAQTSYSDTLKLCAFSEISAGH